MGAHTGIRGGADKDVDVTVTLDGVVITDRSFHVGDQHNYIEHRIQLDRGTHRLSHQTWGDSMHRYDHVVERTMWASAVLSGVAVVGLAACSGSDSESSGVAMSSEPTASPVESAVPDQGIDPDFPAAAPDLLLGAPIVRQFDGLPLTDIAVSPEADRIAVARDSEVCIVSTSPEVPTSADRCYPFPSGIAPGSTTWSPDGTTLVFHHDTFRFGQEPDLVELDLASGEETVLTDDGVPIDGEGGDTDVAPTFTPDGNLHFFRIDTTDGVQAVLHRYSTDGVVTPTGKALLGVPPTAGRSTSDDSIVIRLSRLDGNSEVISVDVNGGTNRSIMIEGQSQMVADVAPDRALLVAPGRMAPGSFELGIADFTSGDIAPIDIPQLADTSMRAVGAGLSPDATRIALILADQDDPNGHLLLVADIAANGSVGLLTVLATGPEFAPNDGDTTIKPAGLGRLGEIVWTDAGLVYSLGPDQTVTLPLR